MSDSIKDQEKDLEESKNGISRCPHDKENPYVMIRKKTVQDLNLSLEARGILAYLLSLPDNWNISIKYLRKIFNIGRDKANSIIENLIDCGYMKKEALFRGNLKRGSGYSLSELPKFKQEDAGQHIDRGRYKSGYPPLTKYCIYNKYCKNKELLPKVKALAEYIFDKYNEFRKNVNEEPVTKEIINKNWIVESERLLKKHSEENIYEVIDFAFDDQFWRKTIKTPSGLRKNFLTLGDRVAEAKNSAIANEEISNSNLEWLAEYQSHREKVGAMGILLFDNEFAWDQKSLIKWKITDSKMKEKILNFYKNKR